MDLLVLPLTFSIATSVSYQRFSRSANCKHSHLKDLDFLVIYRGIVSSMAIVDASLDSYSANLRWRCVLFLITNRGEIVTNFVK